MTCAIPECKHEADATGVLCGEHHKWTAPLMRECLLAIRAAVEHEDGLDGSVAERLFRVLGYPEWRVDDWPMETDQVRAEEEFHGSEGMSLRDYFAAKAMQGLLARMPGAWVSLGSHGDQTVVEAYRIADLMLMERTKSVGAEDA